MSCFFFLPLSFMPLCSCNERLDPRFAHTTPAPPFSALIWQGPGPAKNHAHQDPHRSLFFFLLSLSLPQDLLLYYYRNP
ncbi:hypothetical protein BDV09DRAFT_19737 [Aspergillus tetrazonus]